jgi:hypothetical protein
MRHWCSSTVFALVCIALGVKYVVYILQDVFYLNSVFWMLCDLCRREVYKILNISPLALTYLKYAR